MKISNFLLTGSLALAILNGDLSSKVQAADFGNPGRDPSASSDVNIMGLISEGKPFVFEQGGNQCDKEFVYSKTDNIITERNTGTYLGAVNAGCQRQPYVRRYDCSTGSVFNSCTWTNEGSYGRSTYVETHVIRLFTSFLQIDMLIHNTYCDPEYSNNGYCQDKRAKQVFDKYVDAL